MNKLFAKIRNKVVQIYNNSKNVNRNNKNVKVDDSIPTVSLHKEDLTKTIDTLKNIIVDEIFTEKDADGNVTTSPFIIDILKSSI